MTRLLLVLASLIVVVAAVGVWLDWHDRRVWQRAHPTRPDPRTAS